ncbi:MAG TPA: hypothetical protein VF628_02335 [Allosphingosinicella sp.]|jgi:hypothetical protein
MPARRTAIQPSFNGGELSPRLHARIDQNVYGIGCDTLLGWLPLIQGCITAAPGTHFVEVAAGPCRLIPFEYNVTQGYAIEASAGAFRFYTNDVRLETAPGVPLEVATPWSHAQVLALDYQQSADVLYLVGGDKAPRKLGRTGAASFILDLLDLVGGPIGDANGDQGKTVSASGTTGAITLTANVPIFAAGDVGSHFELEATDYNDVPSWEPGIEIAAGQKRSWAGKVYQCAGGATRTGTVAPIHDEGTEWDGMGAGKDVNDKGPFGVKWTFLYGRHGLAKITGFTSATQVSAQVSKPLADSLTTSPSWRWAFGAFSDTRGWPETVCLWGECLVLTKGATGYVSVVGDLENFERRDSSGDFQRDLSGSFTLPNPDRIKWSVADRVLILGTEKGEYTVERLLTQSGTAGPPIFEVRTHGGSGSHGTKPVSAAGRLVFVQRAGRKLLELDFDAIKDRYRVSDLTRLAEHIAKPGIVEIAWQQEPERLLWVVLANGALAALTYDPEQEVMGWSRRALGGGLKARSACRITDPEGRLDQLWLAVEAPAAGGGAAHWVLRMHKVWEVGDDRRDAFFVDAGLSHDGAPTAQFAGLQHLEGRAIEALADGKPHRSLTVSGGAITLDYPASKVQAGLPYPAVMRTLRIEAVASEGSAQGKIKRIIDLTLRVLETLGIRVAVQNGEQIPVETRKPADAMDRALPLYSGDIIVPTIGAYERGGQMVVERFQPLPATLLALIPGLEVGER